MQMTSFARSNTQSTIFAAIAHPLALALHSFSNWRENRASRHDATPDLDRLDDEHLDDVGLVRRSQPVGWTPVARGLDPTSIVRTTYEAKPRPRG
ncbi:hypothetical protein AOG23_01705 [Rhizobium acidisoli]|nr:hypothetical protein AOG23_01705 [Rhizobium acidisoli]